MDQKIINEIKKTVDQYEISHKGGIQCKCISGARDHLIVKLIELFNQNECAYCKEILLGSSVCGQEKGE